MSQFLQVHLLTPYAPCNLNRDDLGRPKTAFMGGVERLRISSQCIKRAIRMSDDFAQLNQFNLGARTRYLSMHIAEKLTELGMDDNAANQIAAYILLSNSVSSVQPKDAEKTADESKNNAEKKAQIVFYNAQEIKKLDDDVIPFALEHQAEILKLCRTKTSEENSKGNKSKENKKFKNDLQFIDKSSCSVDVALFGRMIAADDQQSVEAAYQMNHPISVSASQIEADYYTAVDDWSVKFNKSGASYVDTQYFSSAIFYTYANVNLDLFKKNLGNLQQQDEITSAVVSVLLKALAEVTPSGKISAFGSRSYAALVLAEVGTDTPRSLVGAFYNPIAGTDQLSKAANRLAEYKTKLDQMYNAKLQSFCLSLCDLPQSCAGRITQEDSLAALTADVLAAADLPARKQ